MTKKTRQRIVPMRLAPGKDAPTVEVRYVGPRRRRELRDAHSKEDPMSALPMPVLDNQAFESALAGEMVVGWSNMTPEFIGAKLVYEDYEDLPTDTKGNVPFTEETMLKLWWDSERFSGAVRAQASRIMEAEIAARKKDGGSSGGSSTEGAS